jgi:hypothetical protein
MLIRRFFAFLSCLLFSIPGLSQDLGSVHEGSIAIKDGRNSSTVFDIPLSPGKWFVAHVANRNSTGSASAKIKDVRLARVDSGVLQEVMEISAKIESSNVNWTDEPCKVEPVLYKNDYGTRLWKQKCLTLGYMSFLQGNNDATRLALRQFSDRSVRHDFNSIRADYTRYGDYGKLLIIRQHFFPSNYGLENPTVGMLNSSTYHPSLIGRDEKKKAMVEALSRHMESVVQAYDAAYDGSSPKRVTAFAWPPERVGSKETDRLELLDKAFSAGLITKEDFEKKRAEIISK